MDFSGKKVLVTGGTRGIGRATVEAFLQAGATVAVNGSSEASVDQALAALGAGNRVVGAPGDLSRVAECRRVVEGAVVALGGLDVLVNNAGVGRPGKRFEEITEEDWNETIDVNLGGSSSAPATPCRRCAPPAATSSTSPRSSGWAAAAPACRSTAPRRPAW